MLHLVTGTPGSGKTLNTIKYITEEYNAAKLSRLDELLIKWGFKKRPDPPRDVYYFNIANLDPNYGWEELTLEQALKWYDLPEGSILVFDEAYDLFPTKTAGRQSAEHIRQLATHRHLSMDIFLICQQVSGQLDRFIHGLVGRHFHFVRVMGTSTVNRYSWDKCVEKPESQAAKKLSNTKTLRLDKKYFNTYHSADQHTHKANYPIRTLTYVVLALLFSGSCFYYLYTQFAPKIEAVQAQNNGHDPSSPSSTPGNNSFSGNVYKNSKSEEVDPEKMTFAQLYEPEIEGLPWTAPLFREVTEAQSWPRPAACIYWHERDQAVCYTQQATRLHIPQSMARQIVDEGFFDWTMPDDDLSSPGLRNSLVRERSGGGRNRSVYLEDTSTRMEITGRSRPKSTERQPTYQLVPRG